MIRSLDEYITIFGANEENLEHINNLFSEYDLIYIGANYCDELIWNRSLELSMKEEKTDANGSNQREFNPTPIRFFNKSNDIKQAFENSNGNWIYARLAPESFNRILKDQILQSKCVLKNNDVIYCMKGIYQGKGEFSELPTKEENDDKKTKITERCIYKMSKFENLADLSFEGKSFNLKFSEFIVGNYEINREDEIAKENAPGSREFILTVALIIFFIIFIYKVSK